MITKILRDEELDRFLKLFNLDIKADLVFLRYDRVNNIANYSYDCTRDIKNLGIIKEFFKDEL